LRTSFSKNFSEPLSAGVRPAIILANVLLPDPDSPTKPKLSPFLISKETLSRSNFKYAKIGKKINIEKSLFYGKKISGHYIQGHVDTTSVIKNIKIMMT